MKLYTNPANYDKIDAILAALKKDQDPTIHYIRPLEEIIVRYDDNIPKDEFVCWERDALPDDKFTIWCDDMANPPWWQIALGLVKEKRRIVYYLLSSKSAVYTMDGVLFSKDTVTPLGRLYHGQNH